MKKTVTLLVVLAGILMVQGCGRNMVWTKDVFTQEEFEQDRSVCEYESAKAGYTPMGAFDSPIMAGLQSGLQQAKVFKLCMQAKGWKLVKQDVVVR